MKRFGLWIHILKGEKQGLGRIPVKVGDNFWKYLTLRDPYKYDSFAMAILYKKNLINKTVNPPIVILYSFNDFFFNFEMYFGY